MPIRNEEAFIEKTINMILNQDYPSDCYEIIIADGCSDDGTIDIIKRLQNQNPQITLKKNKKQRSSAGRNIGFKHGKGDIFLIIDGHCFIPDNQLFKNIVACFKKSAASCLGRPQPLSPPGLTLFQKHVANARFSTLGHGGDSLIYSDYEGFVSPQSNGAIYTREVIEKVGYVDETFDACEDVEFNVRVEKAGFKTYMSPSLTVKYYPRKTIRTLYQQMLRYGHGRMDLLVKHVETFSLKGLIPIFFVLGLFLNLFVLFATSELFIIFVLPYFIYLILITSYSFKLSGYQLNSSLRTYMKIFFTIHLGLGVGQLKGLINIILKRNNK